MNNTTTPVAEKATEKNYRIEIEKDICCDNSQCENCGGKTFYTVFAFLENEEYAILDSSHYTPISSKNGIKEIISQFREELKIKKFSSISYQ